MSRLDDVIDIWSRIDRADAKKHPREWTKDGGELLDDMEVDIVMSTTAEELQAFSRHHREQALAAEIGLSVTEQLRDLMLPYFDEYPECRTVDEAWPHMSQQDRNTARELFAAMRATGAVRDD